MPNLMQPMIGIQNPQQPIGGLLTAGFNPYPQASLNAGPSGGLLTAGMGPWSQMAYQMAGSPKQGGAYAQVAAPPTPVNTNASGSGGGGSAAGSIATGLLGAVLKNPQLLKGAYNGISGLLGGGGAAGGSAASILAGGSPTLSAVGTGAVAPAVDAAAADAGAALGGADAAGAAAGGGLLGAGAGSGAVGAAGANALAASGGFATGGAAGAAGGSGAASAGTLGAAGAAIPLAAAAIPFLIGASETRANETGNSAVNAWTSSTGAKWVNSPGSATSGNQFGLSQNQLKGGIDSGHYVLPNGTTLTKAQAEQAIVTWAKANGIATGNLG